MRSIGLCAFLILTIVFAIPTNAEAQRGFGQRGGRGQRGGGAAVSPKAGAAIDITGYWVSVVSQDWQYRMLTPPKGEVSSVPLNAEGRRIANAWDPAKDAAEGAQCKPYGAAGIMRIPGRLHITWQDDNTLRMELDAGKQTRLLHFGPDAAAESAEPSWQGHSAASWEYATGQRASTPAAERAGVLKVVTTRMRPGYLRKNGVPYSANAVMNETYQRVQADNGDDWLIVTMVVQDPTYLNSPYITSANFRKLPDAAGWNPTPCSPN